MLQDKRIKDLTKDQREKMYLYFHQKIFNKDAMSEIVKRRDIIEDNYFHDIIMEMLSVLLEDESDTEDESDSDSDENIVYSSDITPNKKIKVVYDREKDMKQKN